MRKILIVSPREPSGATWLINCFLHLGIRTYRVASSKMWTRRGEVWNLNSKEHVLKKWMPVLSERESFHFRDDVEICWTHEWPREEFKNLKIIYFVRDPRDALFSRYRRENLSISYQEFASILHPKYLVNKIDYWHLFNKAWLSHNNIKFFRFEDYKTRPLSLLSEIVRWCELEFSGHELAAAVENSTSQKAEQAELEFLKSSNTNEQIVNQGGKTGRWKENLHETQTVTQMIESRAGEFFDRFGYVKAYDPVAADDSSLLTLTKYIEQFKKSRNFFPTVGDNLTGFTEIENVADQLIRKRYKHDWKDGGAGLFFASFNDLLKACPSRVKTENLPLSHLDRFHLALAYPALAKMNKLKIKYLARFFYQKWWKA